MCTMDVHMKLTHRWWHFQYTLYAFSHSGFAMPFVLTSLCLSLGQTQTSMCTFLSPNLSPSLSVSILAKHSQTIWEMHFSIQIFFVEHLFLPCILINISKKKQICIRCSWNKNRRSLDISSNYLIHQNITNYGDVAWDSFEVNSSIILVLPKNIDGKVIEFWYFHWILVWMLFTCHICIFWYGVNFGCGEKWIETNILNESIEILNHNFLSL